MDSGLPSRPTTLHRRSVSQADHLRGELAGLLERARILRMEAQKVASERQLIESQLAAWCGDHPDEESELQSCPPAEQEELKSLGQEVRQVLDTIQIDVRKARDPAQQHAFDQAMGAVEALEHDLREQQRTRDLPAIKRLLDRTTTMWNACEPEPSGPLDYRFQGTVLGCSLMDQKFVRRQLRSLVLKFQSLHAEVQADADATPSPSDEDAHQQQPPAHSSRPSAARAAPPPPPPSPPVDSAPLPSAPPHPSSYFDRALPHGRPATAAPGIATAAGRRANGHRLGPDTATAAAASSRTRHSPRQSGVYEPSRPAHYSRHYGHHTRPVRADYEVPRSEPLWDGPVPEYDRPRGHYVNPRAREPRPSASSVPSRSARAQHTRRDAWPEEDDDFFRRDPFSAGRSRHGFTGFW